jgi:hypothetical protein
MEKKAAEAGVFFKGFVEGEVSVFVIAQNGPVRGGQMAAYLVHAARGYGKFQQGAAAARFRREGGRREPPVRGKGVFPLAADFDVGGDGSARGRLSRADGEVTFFRRAAGKNKRAAGRFFGRFGAENQPRSIAVEPVYEEGARIAGTEQIIQRHAYALAALNGESGGFVKDEDRFIFIDDVRKFYHGPAHKEAALCRPSSDSVYFYI